MNYKRLEKSITPISMYYPGIRLYGLSKTTKRNPQQRFKMGTSLIQVTNVMVRSNLFGLEHYGPFNLGNNFTS
jgi:hypothetical protein